MTIRFFQIFTLSLFISLHWSSPLEAEELPTFPITYLSSECQEIVLAKPLFVEGENHYFLSKNIFSEGAFQDTICLQNPEGLLETKSRFSDNGINFKEAEELILFVDRTENGITHPFLSGIRILKDNKIFQPFQLSNPGGMYLIPIGEKIDWQELIRRIQNVKYRIDKLFDLKAIANKELRNDSLFSWIERNRADFYLDDCRINEDCGWGFLDNEVFNWITASGISGDTWKAGQVFRETKTLYYFQKRNEPYSGYLYDEGRSFASFEGVNFLMEKITNDETPFLDKEQALVFLRSSLKFVFRGTENGRTDEATEQKIEFQTQLLDRLMPVLYEDNAHLKSFAFGNIHYLMNPRDANYKHRINLEKLPELIELYQSESPSKYRGSLAEFIVYHSSEEAWKAISGNDGKILLTTYHLYFDSTKNKLQFHINFQSGDAPILEIPKVRFDKVERDKIVDSRILEPIPKSYFPLPFRNWSGAHTLNILVDTLPKGTWHIRAFGRAGEGENLYWESEPIAFERN